MRKFAILILVFIGIAMFVLSGCGGSNPPSQPRNTPTPTPTPITYLVSCNTFDKFSGQPLTDVSISILETNTNATITANPYQNNLSQGCYTVYFTKPGYISRGYVFNLNAPLTFNVYLNPENEIENYGEVSGKVRENSSDFTDPFYISAGNEVNSNCPAEAITNSLGLFTNISSVCGDIAVSAYTKTADSINKIKYLKATLNPGANLTNLVLDLPGSPLTYSGGKPASDELTIKQSDSFLLARQNSAATDYSFGVELIPGDDLIIESYKSVTDTAYFTRITAGNTGGVHDLQYQTGTPDFTVNSNDTSNYIISFNSLSFASFYEVYAIQITGEEGKVPFQCLGLSGSNVKVPKDLLDPVADFTLIYVRAINLTGFDPNQIIGGTQGFDNYSWTERKQGFDLGASSIRTLSTNRLKSITHIETNIRTRIQLNYLITEYKNKSSR